MASLLTFGQNQEGECQILAHKQWRVDLVNMLASDNNKDQNIRIFTIFFSHARKKSNGRKTIKHYYFVPLLKFSSKPINLVLMQEIEHVIVPVCLHVSIHAN